MVPITTPVRIRAFKIKEKKKKELEERSKTNKYQQNRKRMRAQARDPPGRRDRPQQKHLLAPITTIWLSSRKRSAPAPYPVAMSES